MTDEIHAREKAEHPADQGKPLPHDRDEHPQAPVENAQHHENRKPIDRAHRDVESGIQDTERIGTPTDVPSSGQNDGGKR